MLEKRDGTSFVLGAIIGGFAAYYAVTHKEEIIEKVQKIEDKLNKNETFTSLKQKFESMTAKVQGMYDRFSGKDKDAEDSLDSLMNEIEMLKAQVERLSNK